MENRFEYSRAFEASQGFNLSLVHRNSNLRDDAKTHDMALDEYSRNIRLEMRRRVDVTSNECGVQFYRSEGRVTHSRDQRFESPKFVLYDARGMSAQG